MKILFAVLLNICMIQLSAQYTFFEPKESFAIEVSLDNSTLKRLPIYRNAITSLIVSGDHIIGGTSADEGMAPFIFTASLSKRELVTSLDISKVIAGQRSIRSGFCRGKNNTLYAGTIADDQSKDGGHLIEVKVNAQDGIDIKDLGIPIPGEGIFSLVADSKKTMLYGISFPTGLFFSYNLATKTTRTFKDIIPSKKDIDTLSEYILDPEEYLCKALVESAQGLIFGSLPINKLFYFDPQNQSFHILPDNLPEVWGRKTLGQVEAWAKSKDGKLFGGNAGDGQLFELNPVTKKMKNIGKPVMMPHLRGLIFARDGKLYGIAGALPGYVHLFSYAPGKEGFRDYGNPEFIMVEPGIEQGIRMRGFQLATIASSEDGKYIVMGEDESLSQLLIFAVEGK